MSRDYFYTVFQARESSRPKYHIFQNIPETDLMQKKTEIRLIHIQNWPITIEKRQQNIKAKVWEAEHSRGTVPKLKSRNPKITRKRVIPCLLIHGFYHRTWGSAEKLRLPSPLI